MHRYRPDLLTLLTLIAAANWAVAVRAQTSPAPQARPAAGTAQRTAPASSRGQNSTAEPRVAQAAPQGHAQPQPGGNNVLPVAPFVVTDAEQKLLDQVLLRWEQESSKVKTYVVKFGRWEVDPTFGPKENDFLLAKAEGTIKYMSPDRGEYRVDKVIRWDSQKNAYINDEDALERWMCDGQAIYEWDRKNKQLKVRPLPPELQGKAISEGPLPFVFGAKADELKRRYWFRDVTPKADIRKKIWLEARPKYQKDAANFQRATVVLNEATFLPEALQIYPPGIAPAGQGVVANTAFGFASPSVNSTLDKLTGEFLPPITPPFWKRVVVEDPAEGPQHPQPPAGEPAQATRGPAPSQRK